MDKDDNEEQLVHQHQGLLIHIVKSFSPRNSTEYDDFYSSGLYGLLLAIRKHDPTRAKFSTFAYRLIRNEILRFVEQNRKYNKDVSLKYLPAKSYRVSLAMMDLNAQERQIVFLLLEGRNVKSISHILNKSSDNIYKQIIQIKEKILT